MTMSQTMTEEQLRELIQGPQDVEWKYEMRRECQEILPGLILGPLQAAKSLDILRGLGISHVVCIRVAKEAFSVKPRFPDDFKYMVVDLADSEEQNLIRYFPAAKGFIDTAIQGGGRVLVHCNGGISSSPAFVIMFVMQHFQISWEDALHYVQNRRYCISPNSGFITQIKEYEPIYKAGVAVAQHPAPQMDRSTSRRKRELDDDEEETARFEKRQAVDTDDEGEVANDPDAMEL